MRMDCNLCPAHGPASADGRHYYGSNSWTCFRGPIERELRAIDWTVNNLDTTRMSIGAQVVMRDTVMYRESEWTEAPWTWEDVGSEAIEAASALNL